MTQPPSPVPLLRAQVQLMGALPPVQDWLWGHLWVPPSSAPWGEGTAWQRWGTKVASGGKFAFSIQLSVCLSLPPHASAHSCADVGLPIGVCVRVSMCTCVHTHVHAPCAHARAVPPCQGFATPFTYPHMSTHALPHACPSPRTHARGPAQLHRGMLLSPGEHRGVPALPPPRAHAWLRGE